MQLVISNPKKNKISSLLGVGYRGKPSVEVQYHKFYTEISGRLIVKTSIGSISEDNVKFSHYLSGSHLSERVIALKVEFRDAPVSIPWLPQGEYVKARNYFVGLDKNHPLFNEGDESIVLFMKIYAAFAYCVCVDSLFYSLVLNVSDVEHIHVFHRMYVFFEQMCNSFLRKDPLIVPPQFHSLLHFMIHSNSILECSLLVDEYASYDDRDVTNGRKVYCLRSPLVSSYGGSDIRHHVSVRKWLGSLKFYDYRDGGFIDDCTLPMNWCDLQVPKSYQELVVQKVILMLAEMKAGLFRVEDLESYLDKYFPVDRGEFQSNTFSWMEDDGKRGYIEGQLQDTKCFVTFRKGDKKSAMLMIVASNGQYNPGPVSFGKSMYYYMKSGGNVFMYVTRKFVIKGKGVLSINKSAMTGVTIIMPQKHVIHYELFGESDYAKFDNLNVRPVLKLPLFVSCSRPIEAKIEYDVQRQLSGHMSCSFLVDTKAGSANKSVPTEDGKKRQQKKGTVPKKIKGTKTLPAKQKRIRGGKSKGQVPIKKVSNLPLSDSLNDFTAILKNVGVQYRVTEEKLFRRGMSPCRELDMGRSVSPKTERLV